MKQILVTAGVITANGKFLIAQRLPQGSEGGKWEFPGGKVEPGEDPRACLQRELQEELGIWVKVNRVLEVISTIKAEIQLVLIYFQCRLISGEPKPIECQAAHWLTPAQITPLEKPEIDEQFWRNFISSTANGHET